VALSDQEKSVREAGLASLRRFGRRGAIFLPDLLRQIGGPIDENRLNEVLRRFRRSGPSPQSVPELMDLMDHENPEIRKKAIEFLGLAGKDGEPAVSKLEAQKAGADEETGKLIEQAIERIRANERGLKSE
jgi:hypothetical protein